MTSNLLEKEIRLLKDIIEETAKEEFYEMRKWTYNNWASSQGTENEAYWKQMRDSFDDPLIINVDELSTCEYLKIDPLDLEYCILKFCDENLQFVKASNLHNTEYESAPYIEPRSRFSEHKEGAYTLYKFKEKEAKKKSTSLHYYFDLVFDFKNHKYWKKEDEENKKSFQVRKNSGENTNYYAFKVLLENKGESIKSEAIIKELNSNVIKDTQSLIREVNKNLNSKLELSSQIPKNCIRTDDGKTVRIVLD